MSLQDRLKVGAEQAQQQGNGGYEDQSELPTALSPQQSLRAREGGERRADPYAELKTRIHHACIARLGPELFASETSGDIADRVLRAVMEQLALDRTPLTRDERRKLVREIADDILGYGPLEPYLRDAAVTEVMVNGPNQVYIERSGKLEMTNTSFLDDAHLLRIIDKIVSPIGRRIDESSPMVDARLPDGSRVNAIIPPLALRGPTLTIRKFARDPYTMDDLIGFGTLTPRAAHFLSACVRGKLNMLISGGTGSGKTTTLNAVSAFIPNDERIVTIEDAAELQLQQEHVIPLESRPPNIEGQGEIRIRELVRNSLRMRPDRIIVGEVRGAETLDMLQAMNTGHEGSLTTIHANTPRDALARLETLVLTAGVDLPLRAIREQIAARVRPDRPDLAPRRRLAPRHAHHRGAADGGRDDHAAGRLHRQAAGRGDVAGDEGAAPARAAAVHRPEAALPREDGHQRRRAAGGVLRERGGRPDRPGRLPGRRTSAGRFRR